MTVKQTKDARIAALLLLTALIGCTAAPKLAPVGVATEISVMAPTPLVCPDAFELSARVAVVGPAQSGSVRLRWQRLAGLDRIEIMTPLGGKVAELFANGDYAELRKVPRTSSDGRPAPDELPEQDTSIDQLLSRTLNAPVVLGDWAAWLVGQLPAAAPPGASEAQWRAAGFQVTVEPGSKGQPAKRITLEGEREGVPVKLKLVVEALTSLGATLAPGASCPAPEKAL